MKIKDKLKKWIYNEDPAKDEVLRNLNQILLLLEEANTPYIAAQRIKFLISDIKNNRL